VTQKKRGSPEFVTEFFLTEMPVPDESVLRPLLQEVRKRFGIAPPLELSLWLDPKENLYIDVNGGRKTGAGTDAKPEYPSENETLESAEKMTEIPRKGWSVSLSRKSNMDDALASLAQLEHTNFSKMTGGELRPIF
jgi:hypothetical protein